MQAADEGAEPTSDVDDSPASPGAPVASDGDEDVGAEAARKLRGVSLTKKRPKPQDSGEEVDGDAKRLAPSVSAPHAGEAHTYRLLVPASQRAAAAAVPQGGECTVSVSAAVRGCDEVVVECSSSAGRSTSGDTFPDQAAVVAVLRACLVECDAAAPDGGASQSAEAPPGTAAGDDTTSQSAVVVARLLLPGSQAGAIIGRAGDNIRAVRQASGCAVRVLDADDNPVCVPPSERVVQLTGTWAQVAAALDLVLPLLRELPQRRSTGPIGLPKPHSGGGHARHPGSASPGRSDTQAGGVVASFSAHITVPSSSVGSIIGKSGANIAQIRAISGARIKVHDAVAGSSQRHIEIGGTAEQVAHAQVLVQGFLMTNPTIVGGAGKAQQQQQQQQPGSMGFQQPMQLVAQAQHPMMVTAMPIMYAPPGAMFAQGGQPGMPTLVYMHPGGAGLQPALGYPAPVHMAQVSFMQPQ